MMTGEKCIDVDGINTRYFEKGSGPVVVLFHGGHFGSHDAADCSEDWSLNFDGLAEWFHVFAVDKIGQGFSDNPKRDEDYTMAAVVQHAYGFLKTLGLRNVHPVGHSRGAYLVARLALEHDEGRGQRQKAVVGQGRSEVGEVVPLELGAGSLHDSEKRRARQVGRAVGAVVVP